MNFLDTRFRFASLLWGSIGVGYFIYGKKRKEPVPLAAGMVMIAVSYFVGSALFMSLISSALMAAVYFLV